METRATKELTASERDADSAAGCAGAKRLLPPRRDLRLEAWRRITEDLDHGKLTALSSVIGFDGIVGAAHDIVEGKVRGRLVVEM